MRKVKDLERKNVIRVAPTEKGEEAYHRLRDMNAVRNIMSCLLEKKKDGLRLISGDVAAGLSELRVGVPIAFPLGLLFLLSPTERDIILFKAKFEAIA